MTTTTLETARRAAEAASAAWLKTQSVPLDNFDPVAEARAWARLERANELLRSLEKR